jgi:hypothetical protein
MKSLSRLVQPSNWWRGSKQAAGTGVGSDTNQSVTASEPPQPPPCVKKALTPAKKAALAEFEMQDFASTPSKISVAAR